MTICVLSVIIPKFNITPAGNRKVVLMGCVTSNRVAKSSETLNFQNILQSSGIKNISSFHSTGQFTCEKAGFYFISVVIASNSDKAGFQIMKKSVKVSVSWHTGGGDNSFYTSVIAIAVVELHANDNIEIVADRISSMYDDKSSCLTLFKL
ncbi:unnamed protein product [Mytilus edulis]|uniref:C1q domain-containing protein n=1 Tax=Mytilus edulis TaxID=6550 RepID=A0A8S3VPF8_MYTED|nr:unnamed protein product [Mytilus edulis]